MKKTYTRAEAELINIEIEKTLFTASMVDQDPNDGADGWYNTRVSCNDCELPADYSHSDQWNDYCHINCTDMCEWVEC